ncbi:MAG TPA: fatty acid desaturase [Bacteroidia bacterium]|jgi:beta-carotene hydroxylase|nr:fatty acid desaturase [Bacteroidia bacterium]
MLRYKADIQSVIYMIITTALLIIQWNLKAFNPWLFSAALFMAVTVAVMSHNHNHLPIWKNKTMNILTDWWLTCFYGFPVWAWVPTHNKNHHMLNNKEGDYTITYRFSEGNNLLTLLTYPTISGYYQQIVLKAYLKDVKKKSKEQYYLCLTQIAVLIVFIAVGFIIDWKKALLYIIIPQQMSTFSVLIFNYVQHVHADEESEINHSRNFVGILNFFLLNNGLHYVHHEKAGLHWSKTPEEHKKIEHLIDPDLIEKSFWWYIVRVYILGLFIPGLRTKSKRLERIKRQHEVSAS